MDISFRPSVSGAADHHATAQRPQERVQGPPDRPFEQVLQDTAVPSARHAQSSISAHGEDFLAAVIALENGVSFEAYSHRLSLNVRIGETAVAFEAQPLLADVAIERENCFLPKAGVTLSEERARSLGQIALTPLGARTGESGRENAIIQGRSSGRDRATPPTASLQFSGTGSRPSAAGQVPRTGSASVSGSIGTRHGLLTTDGSSPRGLPEHMGSPTLERSTQLARAQIFAQMIASSSEYRVTVRGMRSEKIDTDQLAKAIRATLLGLGLPDRPIHFHYSKQDA